MTTVQAEEIARRKLSLLQLPQELGNVSKACRIVGYSRQQFYEIPRSLQLHGADGLLDRLPGAKGPHPNRVPAPVEPAILGSRWNIRCTGPSEPQTNRCRRGSSQVPAVCGGSDPQRLRNASPPDAAAGGDGPKAEDQADGRADRGA